MATEVRGTRAALAVAAAGLLLAAACGPDAPPVDDPTADEERAVADVEVPADLEDLTAQAVDDLAERTGVEADEIEVAAAEHVTWSDGSVGCPEPGGMYTQALVEGYRVVLRAEGETHHYHGAEGDPPFHCPEDRRQEPAEDTR